MKTIIEMATQVYGECVWHKSALNHLEAFAELVRADEREANAKLCDEWYEKRGLYGVDVLARVIRARGNT